MKLALGILIAVLSVVSAKASVCDDPLKGDLCNNMRHMRSQVMALGAQRELMQINYDYLQSIAREMQFVSNFVLASIERNDPVHAGGLRTIRAKSEDLIQSSMQSNIDSLVIANTIQKNCASCHSNTPAVVGRGPSWENIFKNDWDHIVVKCNEEGRNPYLCRSMNGMLSAYSSIFTAWQMGRENFGNVYENSKEIARIAGEVHDKKVFHAEEAIILDVRDKALETMKLAEARDAQAFQSGMEITMACMKCHADKNRINRNNPLGLSPL